MIKNTLYHRVIVAGGGGGSSLGYNGCYGGSGGGQKGTFGTFCDSRGSLGNPGDQTGSSLFGSGENRTGVDGCGGGGGWYGGGAGKNYENSGSGGSGFVFNSTNYQNAITAGLKLPTKFFLAKGDTIDGTNVFPSPKNFQNETGHSGDGFIAISYIRGFTCKFSNPKTGNKFIFIVVFQVVIHTLIEILSSLRAVLMCILLAIRINIKLP